MSSDSKVKPEITLESRRRRIPRWVKILSLLVVCGFIFLWNFVPARTIDQPVAMERDEQGKLQTVSDKNINSGGTFEAHAGSLESQNSTTTSSSSGHSTPDFFPSRSISIINLSDHLLMKRAGEEVLKRLKQDEFLERLEYFPAGHLPEAGSLAADLVVTLDLKSMEESGLLGRTLNAEVVASLGTSFTHSHHSVFNSTSPPIVRLHARIQLEHHSTLKGVESSAAQYVLQGKDIGGEIAKAITAKLKELRDKHDALPELPAGFYPEWRPTPDFNFLKKYKVEQLTSVHGLCFHNETFWRINAVENVDETMTSIHKQLQDNGWAGELNEMDRAGPVHLRMSKDSQVLEVFSESWMHRKLNKTDAPRSIDLFVRYRDPMTTDEYHDVFEELLTSQEPDDNLLLKMRRYGSSDQRRRVIELIEENPPHTAFAWIALANHYHAKNDRQATIDALRAAHHLTYAMTDYSAVQNEIRRLTKKLELSVDDIQTIDPSVFKRLGMPVLEYGSGPQVQEIGTGETAAFFARDNSGQWKVASVTLHRKYQQGSQTLYDFTVMESGPDNSRSWSRSSQNLQRPYRSTKHVGNQQVTLEIDRTQDGLIRVTAGTEETPSQDVPAKQF